MARSQLKTQSRSNEVQRSPPHDTNYSSPWPLTLSWGLFFQRRDSCSQTSWPALLPLTFKSSLFATYKSASSPNPSRHRHGECEYPLFASRQIGILLYSIKEDYRL